jgi:hypothetical protein
MDVETTQTWNLQHRFRQNLSVGHHGDKIGLRGPQGLDGGRFTHFWWLLDRKPETLGHNFHRWRRRLEVAAFRAVGLRDDSDDLVAGHSCHGLKARAGQFRGPHECDAHVCFRHQ